jgi:5-methylthioadenosine/S-adenosylhomocysteine deaminase
MTQLRTDALSAFLWISVLSIGCAAAGAPGETTRQVSGNDPPGYLIRNASLVLTMDPHLGSGALGALEDADVLIIGNQIAAVGQGLEAPGGARVIHGDGMIVMPGFVDTHDHLWQSSIRGCGADDNLIGWLNRCVFTVGGSTFTEEDAYAVVRLSTVGLINAGVTTVNDWSHNFNPDFLRGNIRALMDSGLRFHFSMRQRTLDGSDVLATKAQFFDPNPLATLQIGPRAAAAVEADFAAMVQVAKEHGLKIHTHFLEHPDEILDDAFGVIVRSGALELGNDLILAHAIHLTDEEVAILGEAGVSVTHQPLSNMRLASGIIRFGDLKAAGVQLGLGLDGGTNDTPDAFNNMRAAVGLQRVKFVDAAVSPTVEEVLRLATLGGAELLDLDDEVGSLTPGKQADVIVINPNRLNFAPRMNWVNQLVFNGQNQNIEWVFVAGRALKKKGEVVGVKEGDLVAGAEAVAAKLLPLVDE